jgi:methylphosphotriester-DNA--protein-cysteine methyltransferase
MARLCDGDSIVDTANDLGYNDLSQFYDQFGSIAWASPGQFKKTKVKKPQEMKSGLT